MARLIILIAVLAIALIVWHKIKKAKGAEKKKLMFWGVLSGIALVLAALAATGHLNIITAAIAGLVALLPRAGHLLKYLPFLSRLYQQNKTGQQSSPPPAAAKDKMTAEQAREILGLKQDHTEDDVVKAHRRMMQKMHPDRGGSDYLAAQINAAKDVLLS
ncbi:MAG: molecular chaperone DnaJ [Gammaproteobacteria bacterium]|nr:MAG: molecular chaperone DnaJ [Gammaproteobacteria bacterium]